MHVGELAEEEEGKKEGLELGHKEGGGSSNSKPVEEDSDYGDYMEPIDAIPRGSNYGFNL